MESLSNSESFCMFWTARLMADRSTFKVKATSLAAIDHS